MIPTNDEIENKLMELLGRCEVKPDIKSIRRYIVQLLKQKQELQQPLCATQLPEIPEWVVKYDKAGHQSGAGKAIRLLMERISLLERG